MNTIYKNFVVQEKAAAEREPSFKGGVYERIHDIPSNLLSLRRRKLRYPIKKHKSA